MIGIELVKANIVTRVSYEKGIKSYFCLHFIEKYFTETISLLKNFGVGKVRGRQASKGRKP